MIAKKTLLNFFEPFHRNAHNRTTIFAAALCLAGSLFVSASAWANEPSGDIAVNATNQIAVLEPANRLPSTLKSLDSQPAFTQPEPAQPKSAWEIDLELVQDLAVVVEEARKQAQTEYLAQKLRKSPQAVQRYVQLAWDEASRRIGLRPELLLAIMHKESTFRPKVQSRYGAQGLMQVVRRWHREKLHATESLFDPAVNIRVGTDVLEEYLELADGDLSKALAKYSGNARGYANTVISEAGKLAEVAETAAAEVALAPELFELAAAEQAG